ncbi:MAG: penicillin-binding protein activator [Deltaproteobacteria bacterium]|nr:penicillin-binding protein activator [Deltaproteobacteria bacterium]
MCSKKTIVTLNSTPKRFRFLLLPSLFLLFFAFSLVLTLPSESYGENRTYFEEREARNSLWRIFESIELQGTTKANLTLLEDFTREYPKATMTDEALLKLGELYMEEGDFGKASASFERLLGAFPASPHKGSALYGLGYSRYRSGKIKEAQSALEAVLAIPNSTTIETVKATVILNNITSVAPSIQAASGDFSIGVILPLKGPYARFGEDALRGILLAAEVFERSDKVKTDIVVEAIDPTEDNFDEAVDSLYKNKKVLGVIGPLLTRTSPVVAKLAERKNIPIIVLSRKAGIPEIGDHVFRSFLTSQMQGTRLATIAAVDMNIRNFSILHPNNNYGKELAKAFTEEVIARGGTIVRRVVYEPGQRDFGKELQEAFDLQLEEHMVGRRKVREYTPGVQVEALFIPDYYDTITQIAPHLEFYNIENIQLFGANGWNSPKLTEFDPKHVEGAIFVDTFFSESKRIETREFIKRFKKTYGYAPSTIEAEAYDATMALIRAVNQSEELSRKGIRKSLINTAFTRGATGPLSFNEDGEAVKDLFILQVKKGKIKEISTDGLPRWEYDDPEVEVEGSED